MAQKQELRCVIAAGGTAGHVLPAIAVAEALQARGVRVSFAGSPDHIEAQLVAEAGYEFDPFRSAGLPRRAGLQLARALATAARAPAACLKILQRRRPDVVLGGGGYMSGPMVFAAALRRIPTGLLEADAHLGLANRLAAPFADRVFLALPIPGRDGRKYRVSGRPVPRPRRGGAEGVRPPSGFAGPARPGRQPGLVAAERARRRGVGRVWADGSSCLRAPRLSGAS
jgi:UDP-N-acetylglucosamine--N-acetylmuramyl-(pentapeptide) pyrophosphoryl-undecaprenol N-acetylglucosamine transferase